MVVLILHHCVVFKVVDLRTFDLSCKLANIFGLRFLLLWNWFLRVSNVLHSDIFDQNAKVKLAPVEELLTIPVLSSPTKSIQSKKYYQVMSNAIYKGRFHFAVMCAGIAHFVEQFSGCTELCKWQYTFLCSSASINPKLAN